MYTASVPMVRYRAPWDIDFETRMTMLSRGSPRAAYYYAEPDTSTFRYRVYNVARALAASGGAGPSAAWFTRAELDSMDRVLDRCDVLVLCRTRYDDRMARLVEMARARGRRVLFDVDDLVFDPTYAHLVLDTLDGDLGDMAVWDHWFAYIGRMAAAYQLCDGAITTNPYLAARAGAAFRDGRPVRIIPNFLEPEQQALSDSIWAAKNRSGWARDGRIHLGYFSGTPTHNRDFSLIAAPLAQLLDENERLVLRLVGFLDPGPALARHRDRIETVPLQDHMNLQRTMGDTEINLVPLQDNVFTNCKSELKWFEGAIVGALTLATPVYTYRHAIEHGRTGWLVPNQDWLSALREILAGIEDKRDVATAAREAALTAHGVEAQAPVIAAALFED
jgi:hypothetical protein